MGQKVGPAHLQLGTSAKNLAAVNDGLKQHTKGIYAYKNTNFETAVRKRALKSIGSKLLEWSITAISREIPNDKSIGDTASKSATGFGSLHRQKEGTIYRHPKEK